MYIYEIMCGFLERQVSEVLSSFPYYLSVVKQLNCTSIADNNLIICSGLRSFILSCKTVGNFNGR